MAGIINEIKEFIKDKEIGEEKMFQPLYKTGMDILDYRNGEMTDEGPLLGIKGGSIFTIIGKSGTGKSTLAVQIATKIVDNFEHSELYYIDYERGLDIHRLQSLTKWSKEKVMNKAILLNSKVNSESLIKLAKAISMFKNEPAKYNEISIDTGRFDRDGNEIKILPPTVIIVDSIAAMMPKDILEEKEMGGSMAASSIAKTNNAIFKRLTSVLEEGNIILIAINHITEKIEIGK